MSMDEKTGLIHGPNIHDAAKKKYEEKSNLPIKHIIQVAEQGPCKCIAKGQEKQAITFAH